MRLSAALLLALLLGACAVLTPRPRPLPELRLEPALLPAGAWQQQLRIEHGAHSRSFDALLEVGPDALRLVAFAAQQQAFALHWDGVTLHSQQAEWLPPEFDPQWVLTDLQLVLAAPDALAAALPTGWTLSADASGRELRDRGGLRVRIEAVDRGWRIEHQPEAYRLHVYSQSAAVQP